MPRPKYVCRASARRACVVLEQGLKRQVRQMFQCLGLRVRKLVRVRIGSLWGGDLEPGSWRFLDDADVALLLKNPPRQRKYLGASQLVAGTSAKGEQSGKDNDSDEGYVFNPEDFEAGDSYEPTPEMKTRFADTEDEDEIKDGKTFGMIPDSVPANAGKMVSVDAAKAVSVAIAVREASSVVKEVSEETAAKEDSRGDRREGGFQRREGGFGGDRREGGFQRREGGFKRREGGFRRRPPRGRLPAS